jgi:hypothetical protein
MKEACGGTSFCGWLAVRFVDITMGMVKVFSELPHFLSVLHKRTFFIPVEMFAGLYILGSFFTPGCYITELQVGV